MLATTGTQPFRHISASSAGFRAERLADAPEIDGLTFVVT